MAVTATGFGGVWSPLEISSASAGNPTAHANGF